MAPSRCFRLRRHPLLHHRDDDGDHTTEGGRQDEQVKPDLTAVWFGDRRLRACHQWVLLLYFGDTLAAVGDEHPASCECEQAASEAEHAQVLGASC